MRVLLMAGSAVSAVAAAIAKRGTLRPAEPFVVGNEVDMMLD